MSTPTSPHLGMLSSSQGVAGGTYAMDVESPSLSDRPKSKRKPEDSPIKFTSKGDLIVALIAKVEEKVLQLSEVVTANQNTKLEIKQLSKSLSHYVGCLAKEKEEIKVNWKDDGAVQKTKLARTMRQETMQVEESICTECKRKIVDEEKKYRELNEDIEKTISIDMMKTPEAVHEFIASVEHCASRPWKEDMYKFVELKNNLDQCLKGSLALVVAEGDETSALVKRVKCRYEDVNEVLEQATVRPDLMEIFTKSSAGVSKTKLYVVKVKPAAQKNEIVKHMIDICLKEAYTIDFALTEGLDWEFARKVADVLNRSQGKKGVNLIVPGNYRVGSKREVVQNRKKITLKLNQAESGNMNSLMKELKQGLNLGDGDVLIESVKSAENSVEIRAKEGKEGALEKFIKDVGGKLAGRAELNVAKVNTGLTNLIIRNIETTVEEAEVVEGIKGSLQQGDDGTIKILSLRANFRKDGQVARVAVSRDIASRLIVSKQVKIGWLYCPVELLVDPVQCYKCMKHGHRSAECKESTNMSGRCRRCLGENHIAKNCQNAPKCADCGGEHQTGIMACDKFKTMVTKEREIREMEQGGWQTVGGRRKAWGGAGIS